MSVAAASRLTPDDLRMRKGPDYAGAGRIVALTAYTAPVAALLDRHADVLLVGDSLGMVIYGLPSTQGVTLATMIAHAAAVVRFSARACVVVDLPFGSYEESPAQALESSRRVIGETGAGAVKLEGGVRMAETIAHLTANGVAVMGHVGLLPQHASGPGDFRAQGRDEASRARILADARAVEAAGAFATVCEAVVEPLAREIVAAVSIPVIGIGASSACDGQVLVVDDMLGVTARVPRFVKRYSALAGEIDRAAEAYARDVREGRFPGPEHCY